MTLTTLLSPALKAQQTQEIIAKQLKTTTNAAKVKQKIKGTNAKIANKTSSPHK